MQGMTFTWSRIKTPLLQTHKIQLGDGREVRVREYAGTDQRAARGA